MSPKCHNVSQSIVKVPSGVGRCHKVNMLFMKLHDGHPLFQKPLLGGPDSHLFITQWRRTISCSRAPPPLRTREMCNCHRIWFCKPVKLYMATQDTLADVLHHGSHSIMVRSQIDRCAMISPDSDRKTPRLSNRKTPTFSNCIEGIIAPSV